MPCGGGFPPPREASSRCTHSELEYALSRGGDTLRWELNDVEGGTRLTLSHTFTDRPKAPSYAAGWHLGLDALEALIGGHPGPLVVGESAVEHGYQQLFDGYAKMLDFDAPVHP